MMVTEGASVTLSAVKKAASKAAKRGGGREGGDGAATTLPPADPLNDCAAKRLGKLGGMDVCSEFAGALWTKLSGDKTHVKKDGNLTGGTPIPASGLFEALLANATNLYPPNAKTVDVMMGWTGVDDSFLSPAGREPRLWLTVVSHHGHGVPRASTV